jgi:hypothetical protein
LSLAVRLSSWPVWLGFQDITRGARRDTHGHQSSRDGTAKRTFFPKKLLGTQPAVMRPVGSCLVDGVSELRLGFYTNFVPVVSPICLSQLT